MTEEIGDKQMADAMVRVSDLIKGVYEKDKADFALQAEERTRLESIFDHQTDYARVTTPFKLTDEAQSKQIFGIRADRVIDFSARYNFTDAAGNLYGSIRRKGMRSIWKAHYEIYDERENPVMEIHEESAWVKVLDGLVGELPLVGMFTGYFFNPAYLVSRANGTIVARLQKQPAFFEGKFQLTQQAQMDEREETRVLLGVLTMTLLERSRG